jgi:hypothetical protein
LYYQNLKSTRYRGCTWLVPGTIGVHLADRVVQESAKNAKKSENAGEKLAFFTPDLTGKSLSKRTWCQAPFLAKRMPYKAFILGRRQSAADMVDIVPIS